MNNYIAPETELLNIYERVLRIHQEAIVKIPHDFRIRIGNLFQADDLNLESDSAAIFLRRSVLIKFIEEEYKIYIPSEIYRLKKHDSKKSKKNIYNHAEYMRQTLKLLNLLAFNYGINPYEYIEELTKERFIFINQLDVYVPEQFLTASGFKRKLQHENKELFISDYGNVYNTNREPYSADFVNMCREELGKNNTFRSEYNRLGEVRMQLVTHLVTSNNCVDIRNGTEHKEHRGRNK